MENEIRSNFKQLVMFAQDNRDPKFLEAASIELLHKIETFRQSNASQLLDSHIYVLLKALMMYQNGLFDKEKLIECDRISESFKVDSLYGVTKYLDLVLLSSMKCYVQCKYEESIGLAVEADDTYKYCFGPSSAAEQPSIEELKVTLNCGLWHKEYYRCEIAAYIVTAYSRSGNIVAVEPYVVPAFKFCFLLMSNPNELRLQEILSSFTGIYSLIKTKRFRQIDHVLASYMCLVKINRSLSGEDVTYWDAIEIAIIYHYIVVILEIVTMSLNRLEGVDIGPIENNLFEPIYNGDNDEEYSKYRNQFPLSVVTTKTEMKEAMEKAKDLRQLLVTKETYFLHGLCANLNTIDEAVESLPD